MHPPTLQAALVVFGCIVGAAGLALLVAMRTRRGTILGAPGVGRLSEVSHVVIGAALLVAGYHVVVHAAEITGFRAPLHLAVGGALLAIVGTILVDRLEGPADQDEAADDDEPA